MFVACWCSKDQKSSLALSEAFFFVLRLFGFDNFIFGAVP